MLLASSEPVPDASTVGPGVAPGPPWLSLALEGPLGSWDFLLRVWPGHFPSQPRLLHVAPSQFWIRLSRQGPEPSGRGDPWGRAAQAEASPSEMP